MVCQSYISEKQVATYILDPHVSDWLAEYVKEYDAKSASWTPNRPKRRASTKKNPQRILSEESLSYLEWLAKQREDERPLIRDRLEKGFSEPFQRVVAGRFTRPFTERGLRTVVAPIFKYFVSKLPRGGRLRTDDSKENIAVSRQSKLLSLDIAYVEGDRKLLSFIRLDCDETFSSKDACVEALQQKVYEKKIPHLPHLIVGSEGANGLFERPHFLFILKDPVLNDPNNKKCRRGPIDLFNAVSLGLAAALSDIGVDAGAPLQTQRCKNPISPHWHTIVANQHRFASLADYVKVVNTKIKREVLVREQFCARSRLGRTVSNEQFNALLDFGSILLRTWFVSGHPCFELEIEERIDRVFDAIAGHFAQASYKEHNIRYVAKYLVQNFDPKRVQREKIRGRIREQTRGMASTRERQQAGARFTNQAKSSRCEIALKKALAELHELGKLQKMSVTEIASHANVSRSFCYKYQRIFTEELDLVPQVSVLPVIVPAESLIAA